jgi:hypothetical protein
MTIMVSIGLRNQLLDTGSLKSILTDGFIKIYAGTAPASANAAIGAATLLCTISDDGGVDGLDFEAAAAGGILEKASAQTWKGTNVASGTASFYRFVTDTDDGTESTTQARIQGTIGVVGADLNLSSVSLTSSAEQTIDYYVITLPTA